ATGFPRGCAPPWGPRRTRPPAPTVSATITGDAEKDGEPQPARAGRRLGDFARLVPGGARGRARGSARHGVPRLAGRGRRLFPLSAEGPPRPPGESPHHPPPAPLLAPGPCPARRRRPR